MFCMNAYIRQPGNPFKLKTKRVSCVNKLVMHEIYGALSPCSTLTSITDHNNWIKTYKSIFVKGFFMRCYFNLLLGALIPLF